jgi:hypothetical protein
MYGLVGFEQLGEVKWALKALEVLWRGQPCFLCPSRLFGYRRLFRCLYTG